MFEELLEEIRRVRKLIPRARVRDEQEIKEELLALLDQLEMLLRDKALRDSGARRRVHQRIVALTWVLGLRKGRLVLEEDDILLLSGGESSYY